MAYIYNKDAYTTRSNEDYEEFIDEEVEKENQVALKKEKRRKKVFSKIFTNIVLILFTIIFALSTFSIVSYCIYDEDMQLSMKNSFSNVDGIFYADNNVSETVLFDMKNFINELPEPFRETIERDWIIILSDKVPSELFHRHFVNINDYDTSGMVIGGYTFSQSRIVYINSTMEEDVIFSSFVHEVGHIVSFEAGTQHGSEKWETIYRKYMNTFDTDGYNLSNEAEFFAACFEEYFNNVDHLKNNCLEAYEYFNDLLALDLHNETFAERYIMGCKNTFNTLRVYYYFYFVDSQVDTQTNA